MLEPGRGGPRNYGAPGPGESAEVGQVITLCNVLPV